MTMLNAMMVFTVHLELMNRQVLENHFMVLSSLEICFRMLMELMIFVITHIGLIPQMQSMKEKLSNLVIKAETTVKMTFILY